MDETDQPRPLGERAHERSRHGLTPARDKSAESWTQRGYTARNNMIEWSTIIYGAALSALVAGVLVAAVARTHDSPRDSAPLSPQPPDQSPGTPSSAPH